jgi:hypothetical protein
VHALEIDGPIHHTNLPAAITHCRQPRIEDWTGAADQARKSLFHPDPHNPHLLSAMASGTSGEVSGASRD